MRDDLRYAAGAKDKDVTFWGFSWVGGVQQVNPPLCAVRLGVARVSDVRELKRKTRGKPTYPNCAVIFVLYILLCGSCSITSDKNF